MVLSPPSTRTRLWKLLSDRESGEYSRSHLTTSRASAYFVDQIRSCRRKAFELRNSEWFTSPSSIERSSTCLDVAQNFLLRADSSINTSLAVYNLANKSSTAGNESTRGASTQPENVPRETRSPIRQTTRIPNCRNVTDVRWYRPDDTGIFSFRDGTGTVHVWDTESWERVLKVPATGTGLATFGDSGSLGVGTKGGWKLIDLRTGAAAHTFPTNDGAAVVTLDVNSNNHVVASGDTSGRIAIWDVRRAARHALRENFDFNRVQLGIDDEWVDVSGIRDFDKVVEKKSLGHGPFNPHTRAYSNGLCRSVRFATQGFGNCSDTVVSLGGGPSHVRLIQWTLQLNSGFHTRDPIDHVSLSGARLRGDAPWPLLVTNGPTCWIGRGDELCGYDGSQAIPRHVLLGHVDTIQAIASYEDDLLSAGADGVLFRWTPRFLSSNNENDTTVLRLEDQDNW